IAVTDRASWKRVAHLGDLDCFEMDRMTVQAVGFQCSWWSGVATGIVSDNRCRLFCVQATAGPSRRKERWHMNGRCRVGFLCLAAAGAVALSGLIQPTGNAACCYFAAKDKDILQPAQKVFLTWDPVEKVESFTVQPKFEGNAADFGMVIPTPARPKLDEMPRDFFKELAVYTILKKRAYAESKLVPKRLELESLASEGSPGGVFHGPHGGRPTTVKV